MTEQKITPWVFARQYWQTLPVGNTTTARRIFNALYITDITINERYANKLITSFLGRMQQRGYAKAVGKDSGGTLYEKLSTPESKPAPKSKSNDTFTCAELGESILDIIDKLKLELREYKADLTQAIEDKTNVERLYAKAQDKILELNNQLQCKKGRGSISLHELQEVYNTLSPK